MPNGRPGDDPITDLLNHYDGEDGPYTAATPDLVRGILRVGDADTARELLRDYWRPPPQSDAEARELERRLRETLADLVDDRSAADAPDGESGDAATGTGDPTDGATGDAIDRRGDRADSDGRDTDDGDDGTGD